MPRVKPEDRKRARRPKTRTGCRTCKIRRVKCDEARPGCQRCVSTGRTCDGYELPLPASEDDVSKISPPMQPLPGIFRSTKEHRSFAFYLEITSRQVAGLYECEFWERLILQAARSDPAVRHAVTALGSLHEVFEKTGEAENIGDDFAMQQYNLAIRQHLDCLTGSPKDISKVDSYVASCMIFMCIELIQGHYLSAISLIRGAVKLFYENCVCGSSAWPSDIIETILSRLQSQAVGLLPRSVVGQTIPPQLKDVTDFQMPERFETVAEARQYLEFYNHSHILLSSANGASEELEAVTLRMYLEMLGRWTPAFDGMMADELTGKDRRAASVLQVWRLLIEGNLKLRASLLPDYDNQELYDEYESTFREVVSLAESVLQGFDHGTNSSSGTCHRFTLDIGLVGPLYDTARICRDPIIRRKAVHLLRAYPCREGLWDSRLAASSAARQIELEESAVPEVKTSADIPGWARISSARPAFRIGQRWTSVVYTRQRPLDGSPPMSVEEIISW